jgi:hypothetical protein
MHDILFDYKGAKHYVAKTNNQIVDNFIIATRVDNVYVKETMFIGDAFISVLAIVQEHDITFTVSSTMIRTCNQTSQL